MFFGIRVLKRQKCHIFIRILFSNSLSLNPLIFYKRQQRQHMLLLHRFMLSLLSLFVVLSSAYSFTHVFCSHPFPVGILMEMVSPCGMSVMGMEM